MSPMQLLVVTLLSAMSTIVWAGGISIDSGLTPSEDRWILRTQIRYMHRNDDPSPMDREMTAYMVPVILAYGLRSDLTIMARQTVIQQEMSMSGTDRHESGFGDLFILAKYKAYRINTPEYTFGIAPTLGLELPTGKESLSSGTWDLKPGLFMSWQNGSWMTDFNVAYSWNGFADKSDNGVDPGDELSLNIALAYQFSIGEQAASTVLPVLEFTYKRTWADRQNGQSVPDTGEFVFNLSPGIKYIASSYVLEALIQVPVYQDQTGSQPQWDVGMLAGARFLF